MTVAPAKTSPRHKVLLAGLLAASLTVAATGTVGAPTAAARPAPATPPVIAAAATAPAGMPNPVVDVPAPVPPIVPASSGGPASSVAPNPVLALLDRLVQLVRQVMNFLTTWLSQFNFGAIEAPPTGPQTSAPPTTSAPPQPTPEPTPSTTGGTGTEPQTSPNPSASGAWPAPPPVLDCRAYGQPAPWSARPGESIVASWDAASAGVCQTVTVPQSGHWTFVLSDSAGPDPWAELFEATGRLLSVPLDAGGHRTLTADLTVGQTYVLRLLNQDATAPGRITLTASLDPGAQLTWSLASGTAPVSTTDPNGYVVDFRLTDDWGNPVPHQDFTIVYQWTCLGACGQASASNLSGDPLPSSFLSGGYSFWFDADRASSVPGFEFSGAIGDYVQLTTDSNGQASARLRVAGPPATVAIIGWWTPWSPGLATTKAWFDDPVVMPFVAPTPPIPGCLGFDVKTGDLTAGVPMVETWDTPPYLGVCRKFTTHGEGSLWTLSSSDYSGFGGVHATIFDAEGNKIADGGNESNFSITLHLDGTYYLVVWGYEPGQDSESYTLTAVVE